MRLPLTGMEVESPPRSRSLGSGYTEAGGVDVDHIMELARCEFCGAPGHLIPIPEPIVAVEARVGWTMSRMETRVTCPEHRSLVQMKAERELDAPAHRRRM